MMSRLEFLGVVGECHYDLFNQHCILAKGLQFFTTELKFLYWNGYPLKSLPRKFVTKAYGRVKVNLIVSDGYEECMKDNVTMYIDIGPLTTELDCVCVCDIRLEMF